MAAQHRRVCFNKAVLHPEVYRAAYGIEAVPVPAPLRAPALYQMRSLSGTPLLTTSPFITDTLGFPSSPADQGAYKAYAIEACKQANAAYSLIKTRDAAFAATLDGDLTISRQFVTSILDLTPGESLIWQKSLHSKRRKQVQKGNLLNPEFRIGRDAPLLEDFYTVFVATQTALGTPAHSLDYFLQILKHHPEAQFIVGYVGGRAASVAILLAQEGVLYHPYTGTLPEFLPTYLNCSLYWRIIQLGLEIGCKSFDMGRSFKDSGVHQFKRYWGPADIDLYYAYYLHKQPEIPKFDTPFLKFATRTWSLMPPALARRLGPRFIRSVP